MNREELDLVAVKAPASDKTIPAEFENLPTDVVEVSAPILIDDEEEPDDFDPGVPKDLSKRRPIIGGIRIRGARSADLERRQSFGTLGCFAITTGKDAGKRVLLTNHHVLDDPIGELHGPSCTGCTKGDGVGNPNTGDQIATVLRGKNNAQLDAAIAVLDSGVQFQREIIRDDLAAGSEVIRGTRVLTSADEGIEVHKRGHRTLTTFGLVGKVGIQSPLIEGKHKQNQIRIDLPNKVGLATSVTFQANGTITVPAVDFVASNVRENDLAWIQGSLNNGGPFRIKQAPQPHEIVVAGSSFTPGNGSVGFFVTPPHFGLKGDSGSVLLDQSGNVVALLWAATPDQRIGNAWATPIDVVERELRIKIDTAAAINDIQTARLIEPEPQTDPAVLRPAAIVAGGGAAPPINLRERVEDDLKAVSRGREIYDLYFTHHLEVRELLDSNDQIARAWHRQGGPAIIQSVLDAVRSRETTLPVTIRGKSWAERVKAILAVFAEHGSTRLRDDIKRFGDEVAGLAGFTYPQLLETLGK